MRRVVLFGLVALLATAGCIGADEGLEAANDTDLEERSATTSVHERSDLGFVTDDAWSHTLEEGSFALDRVEEAFIPVDIPLERLGGAVTGDVQVHMGVFLPDVPEGTPVPVIADVGPYYGELDTHVTEPAHRLGGFLIEQFVPHGYAVAQVSVLGSGESTHCMDLMGEAEQLGVDAAVTYLGEQEWSAGEVALIGRSYDGSTPWQAAQFGNEHLSTIVPISGLTGVHELMWKNGTAETRAPIMHNVVYGAYGIQTSPEDGHVEPTDTQQACTDYLTGPIQGLGAYITGDHFLPEVNSYWEERYFLDDVLENYEGSVYFIHGLQDWNVNPHMAFPAYQQLIDAGIETKGLFGQWGHHYPDRIDEHEGLGEGTGAEAFPQTVRYDWAQDLLEWFDHYLMGTGEKPALHAEVQDHQGEWRTENTYPPRHAERVEITLNEATTHHEGPTAEITPVVDPTNELVYRFNALDAANDTRIAGNTHVHLTVTPTGPGGQLFAELRDATLDLRLGHATMDLRFHEGSDEKQTITPGEPIVAKMHTQVKDVILPAGHELELRIAHTGMGYLPSVISSPVTVHEDDESILRLPVIDPHPDAFFTAPGHGDTAEDEGESREEA